MLASFQLYGPDHITTLLFLLGVTILLIRNLRRDAPDYQSERSKRIVQTLAFLCFSAYPINQLIVVALGGHLTIGHILPFHLCDLAAFICGFALLTRKPILCELSYFWGLAGTMQALLTPDLNRTFPDPIYLSFFFHHGIIVITAIVLPLGLGWRPRKHSALRVFGWTLMYAVAAFCINAALHTNYGFVMEKPEGASLLNALGPWPWYILWSLAIASVIFLLLELPFRKRNQSERN